MFVVEPSSDLGDMSVFEAELLEFIISTKFVVRNNWLETLLVSFLLLGSLLWCLVVSIIDGITVFLLAFVWFLLIFFVKGNGCEVSSSWS